jgi:hypothetical protein
MDTFYGLTRIVYENGIDFLFDEQGYGRCLSVKGNNQVHWHDRIANVLQVKPMLYVYQIPQGIQETLLPKTALSEIRSQIDMFFQVENAVMETGISVEQFHDLIYVYGALEYHLKNLSKEYCKATSMFVKIRHHGEEKGEADSTVPSAEILYEFDSFITTSVQCYEILRTVLWSHWGNSSSRPRSYKNLLKSASDLSLPNELRQELLRNWEEIGIKADDYRDLIQHNYTLTPNGWPLLKMNCLGDNIWGTSMFLPDNPEEKSRPRYKYDKKIDALQYAWFIADEMMVLFCEVAKYLPPRKN